MDPNLEPLARQIYLALIANRDTVSRQQKYGSIAYSNLMLEAWELAKEWVALNDEINVRWITNDYSSESNHGDK